MAVQPSEILAGKDPYQGVRDRIASATQKTQEAIDHFNGSLVGINGDLEVAHTGMKEIVDAEVEARRIRVELGFRELSKRGLDFCSGSHPESLEGLENLSEDERLRQLGAIPSEDLTAIVYKYIIGEVLDDKTLAGRFCQEHSELGPRVLTVDSSQLAQEEMDELLRNRTAFAFDTFRGKTIMDVLAIPDFELPEDTRNVKQALHPEASVPIVIWPIVPTISGDPKDFIKQFKPPVAAGSHKPTS